MTCGEHTPNPNPYSSELPASTLLSTHWCQRVCEIVCVCMYIYMFVCVSCSLLTCREVLVGCSQSREACSDGCFMTSLIFFQRELPRRSEQGRSHRSGQTHVMDTLCLSVCVCLCVCVSVCVCGDGGCHACVVVVCGVHVCCRVCA